MKVSAHAQVKEFLEHARWFGGKGLTFEVTSMRRLSMPTGRTETDDPEPTGRTVVVELAELTFDDGSSDTYQLPTSYYPTEQEHLSHALIGHWSDDTLGEVWAYDALHDHAATPLWLWGFAEGDADADVRFTCVAEHPFDPDARSTIFTGQQSNSSVAFGEDSLMKVFRRVTPGHNPDIEILAALSATDNEHIATLFGYAEAGDGGEPLQLAILQQFLRTASDGWDLALVSLRNLFADAEVAAREAGGDFAAEARRLGVAVADLHSSLAEAFPTETVTGPAVAELADRMSARLDSAVAVVPELAALAPGIRTHFDALRHHGAPLVIQRIHGDLHLGQTLRTVKNWKIIDFEGEPAKTLEERRRADSPWRDVAGMIRSFDYAAELSRVDHEQATGDADQLDQKRAREWSSRNLAAFLAGYRDASGHEVDRDLVTAYVADKAVYEAVYESRNRPAWLPIPMAALTRLGAGADTTP